MGRIALHCIHCIVLPEVLYCIALHCVVLCYVAVMYCIVLRAPGLAVLGGMVEDGEQPLQASERASARTTNPNCTSPRRRRVFSLASLSCSLLLSLALPCFPLLSLAFPCFPLLSLALPCPPLLSLALPCPPLPSLALPCPPLLSLAHSRSL